MIPDLTGIKRVPASESSRSRLEARGRGKSGQRRR
jgi:hypothetical protein